MVFVIVFVRKSVRGELEIN